MKKRNPSLGAKMKRQGKSEGRKRTKRSSTVALSGRLRTAEDLSGASRRLLL
jgi:hypothetical protein